MTKKRIIAVIVAIAGCFVALMSQQLGDDRQNAKVRNSPFFQRVAPTREPVDETVGIPPWAQWTGFIGGTAFALWGMSLWPRTAPSQDKPTPPDPDAD